MAIVVQNNQGLLAPNSSLSASFWASSKPRGTIFLNWVLGTANLGSMNLELEIPYYKAFARWENYTDFEIELSLDFGNSVRWLKINGNDMHKSVLDNVVVENGITSFRKTINLSFVNLNVLSLGHNSVQCMSKIHAYNLGVRELVSQAGGFMVFVNVQRYFQPKINIESSLYTVLGYLDSSFYKTTGVYLPNKGLYVFHNTPITISHPNFIANITNFNYYSYITFDVNRTWLESLSAGNHELNFSINYDQGSTPFKLVVTVYEDVTPSTDLSVLPSELSIDIYRNADATNTLSATVFSNTNWYVDNELPLWLTMSKNSGNGVTDITFNFVNYVDLLAGVYNFNLPIKSDVANVSLPITMNLFDFVKYPFVNGGLFFTLANEAIEFNVIENDCYINLLMNITMYKLNVYEPLTYVREFKIPLYKGKGAFNPGKIVHELYEDPSDILDMVSVYEGEYIKNQYAPANVNIEIQLKRYSDESVVRTSLVNNVMFVKGQKPFVTSSNLAILSLQEQEFTSITPNSIIAFGFVSRGSSVIRTYLNGILQHEKDVVSFSDNIEKSIRSYFCFDNPYKVGDHIEYQIQSGLETRIKRYIVMPSGPSITHVLFENNNGITESFELRGRKKINGNKSHTTQTLMRGIYEVEKKIATDSDYTLSVNAGQLIKGDIPIIESIIDSHNVWVSYDNKSEWIQVDCVTNKTDLYDDFENEIEIVLEFNVLKNNHARVYPSRF